MKRRHQKSSSNKKKKLILLVGFIVLLIGVIIIAVVSINSQGKQKYQMLFMCFNKILYNLDKFELISNICTTKDNQRK